MKYFLSPDKPQIYKNLLRHLSEMNPGLKWQVSITKDRASKTDKQRNYFHALLDLFEAETGNDAQEIKMKLKYETLPLTRVKVYSEIFYYPPSSEDISAEEYGHLIESIQMLCVEFNIKYPQPEHYG